MSGKQLFNQRKIFKITSDRLKENDWNLELSLEEAYSREEVVSLGDSQTLRFIRKASNDTVSEDYITSIKKQIDKTKKIKKISREKVQENNIKIKALYRELDSIVFIKDYVSIVFESKADFNRACRGFTINGKKFKRLVGTTGGVKKNTVQFCSEEVYDYVSLALCCDYNKETKLIPAKFEAYKALSCSASTPVTMPRILVIKDGKTRVEDKVVRIYSDETGEGFKVDRCADYVVEEKEFCDGCGMMTPQYAEQIAKDLQLDYIPSGVNTRFAFEKGMLGTFDFVAFGREIMNGNYMVEDCWGNMQDIREVDIIITTNMLKLWNAYDSIEDYMAKCKKYGYEFSVTKVTPKELEDKRNTNYQYLQSFENMQLEDIKELCEETVDDINGVLGDEVGKALLFAGSNQVDSIEGLEKLDMPWLKALMIEPSLIDDSYIKDKLYKMINKRIEMAEKGTLKINGNYAIILGDLYALCQSMYGLEPTGLLGKGEFYSRYWQDRNQAEVLMFRSPMTSHNNIARAKIKYDKECDKWFKYLKTVIVFNNKDLVTETLNGAD